MPSANLIHISANLVMSMLSFSRNENMHPLPEMESVDTEAAGISSEPSSSISEKASKVHSEESDLDR